MPPFRFIVIFLAAYAFMATFAFCDDFHESDSQVWRVGQNRWTVQEEDNCSKWIETNVAEDFFIRHDMRVDCADVPINIPCRKIYYNNTVRFYLFQSVLYMVGGS